MALSRRRRTSATSPAAERRRIRALIEGAGVAMLFTIDEHGNPSGRPMRPLLLENDTCLYFLTQRTSRKMRHLVARPQVALAATIENCHLVLTGSVTVLRNRELIERLWEPTYRAWFPDGKNDRRAVVLRMTVARVDYWEPPRSRAIRAAQAVKAALTRRAVETPMKTLRGL
jgi:general stress protein 26